MTTYNEQVSPETLLICVCDEVRISDVVVVTVWSFALIEGISYGYLFANPEEFEDSLPRAYNILFEETLKRLEAKGVHLRL